MNAEQIQALYAAIDDAVSKLGWTEETDKALAALTAPLAASPAPMIPVCGDPDCNSCDLIPVKVVAASQPEPDPPRS